MPLDDKDSALLAHVNSRWTADLAFLERLVRINSGSGNLLEVTTFTAASAAEMLRVVERSNRPR